MDEDKIIDLSFLGDDWRLEDDAQVLRLSSGQDIYNLRAKRSYKGREIEVSASNVGWEDALASLKFRVQKWESEHN